MKNEIHPQYQQTPVQCACGNNFTTGSTMKGPIKVEVCYICHPFYTGKQKIIDSSGRVDKFKQRQAAAASKSEQKKAKSDSVETQEAPVTEEVMVMETVDGNTVTEEKIEVLETPEMEVIRDTKITVTKKTPAKDAPAKKVVAKKVAVKKAAPAKKVAAKAKPAVKKPAAKKAPAKKK